ncbi:MAG TPA: YiaA/YiaB family inner membrane protein [Acidimicrobiales bacterium]|jgi:hypothetical protein|nr:YiaA/YiaB family inner membrane protein [Acidimicrobiales bacterium]
MTTPNVPTKQTTAFYVQSAISFAVSLSAMLLGIAYLPVNGWVRGFLCVGALYLVTSTFTLAKCVRDAHEAGQVLSRVDQARLERLLATHDPFVAS